MTDISPTGSMPISAYTGDGVERIPADASLLDAADALVARDISALVVMGDDIAGIVTERDVVRALADRRDPAATRVAEVASRSLVYCEASATVAEVAERMMQRYVRHVLIEDGGSLVGIVSARDLLGVYAAADVDDDLS